MVMTHKVCAAQVCANCQDSQHVHIVVVTDSVQCEDDDCSKVHTQVVDVKAADDESIGKMSFFNRAHEGPFEIGMLADPDTAAQVFPEFKDDLDFIQAMHRDIDALNEEKN